jgi:hypothetical protein
VGIALIRVRTPETQPKAFICITPTAPNPIPKKAAGADIPSNRVEGDRPQPTDEVNGGQYGSGPACDDNRNNEQVFCRSALVADRKKNQRVPVIAPRSRALQYFSTVS